MIIIKFRKFVKGDICLIKPPEVIEIKKPWERCCELKYVDRDGYPSFIRPPAREEDNRRPDIVIHEKKVRFFQSPEPPEDYVPEYTFNDFQGEVTEKADKRRHRAPRLAFGREDNLDLSKGSPHCLSPPIDIPRGVSRRYVVQVTPVELETFIARIRSEAAEEFCKHEV
ncbi:hypothetical protein TNIN_120051 [Trichonephila inaurata madagascariensis]|uniref:Uncharacterized protein n=1 Tax=Trichonephila inaurata madagascariensis TaxID=2747483 RepID=A0A8X6WZR9_9ARAC|nr:hypothetical protein TNIN_120051 [Trichonephila inaurata madagascariensis]